MATIDRSLARPARRHLLAAAVGAALSFSAQAQVQPQTPAPAPGQAVTIGVMTDMSGVLSDLSGQGSLAAVQMAVEDMGGKVLDRPIVVLDVDHQNKADIAANKAREWFDVNHVDMITDLTNSSVALAVVNVAADKKRIAVVNGAGTTRLTNDSCTPYSLHYAWDTYAMANGTAKALIKRGGDSWYFLTADYAFGHQIERDVSQVVKEAGGKVLGSARHPFNANDFSSFMLQAQASGARIIALANGGTDASATVDISQIIDAGANAVGGGDANIIFSNSGSFTLDPL